MHANRWTRRQFLAACGLSPLALAGCGKSSDKDGNGKDDKGGGTRDEAAVRVVENLKVIGAAMHNFYDGSGRLPIAGWPALPKDAPVPRLGKVVQMVLPPQEGTLSPNNTPWRIA